jgi:hypothetical protein
LLLNQRFQLVTKFELFVQQLYQITAMPGALRPRAACIAQQQCKAMGAAELVAYSAYLAERHQQLVPNSGPTIVGACGTNAANILSIEADQLLRRVAVIETALAVTQANMARTGVRAQATG